MAIASIGLLVNHSTYSDYGDPFGSLFLTILYIKLPCFLTIFGEIMADKVAEKVTAAPTVSAMESKKLSMVAQLKYMRDKDREIVRGIFKYHEVPGGSFSFIYKAYKEDPVERYDFVDGQVYSIPLGVAKHLNKNGWYPVHAFALDDYGKSTMKIGQKVRRFGFNSLEFVDIDDLTPEGIPLLTVEKVASNYSLDQYNKGI